MASTSTPAKSSYLLLPSASARIPEFVSPVWFHQKLMKNSSEITSPSWKNMSLLAFRAFCHEMAPFSIMASYHMMSMSEVLWT